MKRLVLLSTLLLSFNQCFAISMPAPPPELPDTLTDFRTKEQVEEQNMVEPRFKSDNMSDINVHSAPFVPGDEELGILRFSINYNADTKIGVPAYGLCVLRFYSSDGIPLEITDVKLESPGFSAETTASASELLIKQKAGSSKTTMLVKVAQSSTPLVFNLTSVYLKNNNVPVSTILSSVKVKTFISDNEYVFPKTVEIPKANPLAASVQFSTQSFNDVEKELLQALDELKDEIE